jgi:hypothetical protein
MVEHDAASAHRGGGGGGGARPTPAAPPGPGAPPKQSSSPRDLMSSSTDCMPASLQGWANDCVYECALIVVSLQRTVEQAHEWEFVRGCVKQSRSTGRVTG